MEMYLDNFEMSVLTIQWHWIDGYEGQPWGLPAGVAGDAGPLDLQVQLVPGHQLLDLQRQLRFVRPIYHA